MIILLDKIIRNGIEKGNEIYLENHIDDIFETDTNNMRFKDTDVFFDTTNKFIFNVDILTLTWLKEILSLEKYLELYSRFSTLEKINFVNISITEVLYNQETALLDYIVTNEKDYNIRKAISQEIRKMESNNEGIVTEFITEIELLEKETEEMK